MEPYDAQQMITGMCHATAAQLAPLPSRESVAALGATRCRRLREQESRLLLPAAAQGQIRSGSKAGH